MNAADALLAAFAAACAIAAAQQALAILFGRA